MLSEEQQRAFLAALHADPEDWDLRLVYADFLEEQGEDEEAARQRAYRTAREWMNDFARKCYDYDDYDVDATAVPWSFEDVVQAGIDHVESGDVLVQYGSEKARNLIFEDEFRDAYWKNWEIITGKRFVPDEDGYPRDGRPFGCSC